ncbi:MAG: hypothetical protein OXF02_04015 [Simkaniaceae bacterium]|nr:hypothetical protein [Simkaniaceae bacterium]
MSITPFGRDGRISGSGGDATSSGTREATAQRTDNFVVDTAKRWGDWASERIGMPVGAVALNVIGADEFLPLLVVAGSVATSVTSCVVGTVVGAGIDLIRGRGDREVLRADVEACEASVAVLRGEIRSLRSESSLISETTNTMKRAGSLLDEENRRVRSDLEGVNRTLDALVGMMEVSKSENDALRGEVDALVRQCRVAEEQLREVGDERDKLLSEKRQVDSELSDVRQSLVGISEDRAVLIRRQKELEERLVQWQALFDSMGKESDGVGGRD